MYSSETLRQDRVARMFVPAPCLHVQGAVPRLILVARVPLDL